VVDRRGDVDHQIDDVIAASFLPGTPGLDAAIATLQTATKALTDLDKTIQKVDQIINDVDAIVQAATAVLAIVG